MNSDLDERGFRSRLQGSFFDQPDVIALNFLSMQTTTGNISAAGSITGVFFDSISELPCSTICKD